MPLASTARWSMQRGAVIELALHQPVHEMEEGDAGTGLGEAVGGFEAEQPAADHHHPGAGGLGRGDGVDVVDVTEGEHARQIASRECPA